MTEIRVPHKTAGECTLPNGDVVWVKTLNQPEKSAVQRSADDYATDAIVPYVTGGAKHALIMAKVCLMESDSFAEKIALEAVSSTEFWRQLNSEFPLPERPSRPDDEKTATLSDEERLRLNEEHALHVVEWNVEIEELTAKRVEAEERVKEQARAAFLAKSIEGRQERMATWMINALHWENLLEGFDFYLLMKAVRKAPNSAVPYFTSLEQVQELDDETRETLLTFYGSLDSVRVEDVPTSPAGVGESQG